MARWLLPEGISDVLPHEAARLEQLRRDLLDLYRAHGYALVVPPLIEYLDSLLTGTGRDLDLRTFKLVDQLSGRQLGLRADLTPQTARIDAHILNRSGVVRLCYAGSVLHTRPAHPLASREPLQVGAELYGFAGRQADAEVQSLAIESLRRAGVERVSVDLGHTGIVRSLLAQDAAAPAAADDVLAALGSKDLAALNQASAPLAPATRAALLALATLNGDRSVLQRARHELAGVPGIAQALDDLEWLCDCSRADAVSVDLADLHGYRYYTGVNFAVYDAHARGPLLRGGRYDDIGRAFGRARPATGFSIDLRELSRRNGHAPADMILAPPVADAALAAEVAKLRAAGEIVVEQLDERDSADPAQAGRMLQLIDGRWQLVRR